MSTLRRRADLKLQREEEDRKREAEERRRAGLSMWARIEEADASADVKEILHMMAAKLGMEGDSIENKFFGWP